MAESLVHRGVILSLLMETDRMFTCKD